VGATIAGTAYATIAIVAAFVLRPRFATSPAVLRGYLFWFVAAPVLFILPLPLAALAICGGALAFLAPRELDDRAAFYLLALFAIPASYGGLIPFPGLNYLIYLDFPKLAALILLLPVIALAPVPNSLRHAPTAGAVLVAVTILFSLQEFRTANLTSGLRVTFYNVLLYLVPFAALVRLLPSRESFEKVFQTFAVLGVIFACSAGVSQVIDWNFYTYLAERLGDIQFADFRAGILRTGVTTAPTFAAYIAALGLLGVEYFRARRKCGLFTAWMYRGLFIVAAFITGARGGWLAMTGAVAAFWFFAHAPRALRPPALFIGFFVCLPALFVFLMTTDLSRFDRYGSFEYRRELLEASFVQIRERPLFGDPHYIESGNFSHLVQGQGIIDIVNYYLQIVLEQGIVGLALYAAAFLAAAIGLLGLGRHVTTFPPDDPFELQRAVLLAALLSYLAMMGTISAVSFGAHIGVLLLALSTAFVAAARKEIGEQAPARATAPAGAAAAGDLYA
jgi:O-antigen ligase